MTNEDEKFLEELKDILEIKSKDELSANDIIVMMDKKFNKQIPLLDFLEVTSLDDLAKLLGRRHFKKEAKP